MAESKSAALPLGYAPTGGSLPPWRADHSGEAWTDQRPLTAPPHGPLTAARWSYRHPGAAASGHAEQIAKPGKPGFRPPAAAFLSQRLQKSFCSRLPHRHGQDLLAVLDRTATKARASHAQSEEPPPRDRCGLHRLRQRASRRPAGEGPAGAIREGLQPL